MENNTDNLSNIQGKMGLFNGTNGSTGMNMSDVELFEVQDKRSSSFNTMFSSFSAFLFRYLKYLLVFIFFYYIWEDCNNGKVKDPSGIFNMILGNTATVICFVVILFAFKEYMSDTYFNVDNFLKALDIKPDTIISSTFTQPSGDEDTITALNNYKRNLSKQRYDELNNYITGHITPTANNISNYIQFWYNWGTDRWDTLSKAITRDESDAKEQFIRGLYFHNDTWYSGTEQDDLINLDNINLAHDTPTTNADFTTIDKPKTLLYPFEKIKLHNSDSLWNFFTHGANSKNINNISEIALTNVIRKAFYAVKISSRFKEYKSMRCMDFVGNSPLFEIGDSINTKYNSGVDKQDESCSYTPIDIDNTNGSFDGENSGFFNGIAKMFS